MLSTCITSISAVTAVNSWAHKAMMGVVREVWVPVQQESHTWLQKLFSARVTLWQAFTWDTNHQTIWNGLPYTFSSDLLTTNFPNICLWSLDHPVKPLAEVHKLHRFIHCIIPSSRNKGTMDFLVDFLPLQFFRALLEVVLLFSFGLYLHITWKCESESVSHSVESNSLGPHGL